MFFFAYRHKDVVQRQNMLWDAKYQQLRKYFELAKDSKAGLLLIVKVGLRVLNLSGQISHKETIIIAS